MNVPKLPEKPVDGFTIEYWSFESCDSWRPGLRRHLAIYIENMTWAEFVKDPRYKQYHTYDESDRPGGAFIDNWIMIGEDGPSKMRFDGRNEGWLWPYEKRGGIGVVYTKEQRWAEVYATPAEALEAFKANAERSIASKKEDIAKAERALAAVLAEGR